MRLLDQILASKAERHDAITRAEEAIRDYGDDAVASLQRKLADPRRRRSRRAIRLAIAKLTTRQA